MSVVKGYGMKVSITDGVTGRVVVVAIAMSGDIDLFDTHDCISRFMRLIARYAIVAATSEDKYS